MVVGDVAEVVGIVEEEIWDVAMVWIGVVTIPSTRAKITMGLGKHTGMVVAVAVVTGVAMVATSTIAVGTIIRTNIANHRPGHRINRRPHLIPMVILGDMTVEEEAMAMDPLIQEVTPMDISLTTPIAEVVIMHHRHHKIHIAHTETI